MSPAKNRPSRSPCGRSVSGLVNAPVELLAEVQLEAIVGAIRTLQPEVVVIDSIQTVYTEALESAPGSVAQVRECAAQLTRLAKQSAITVILVGHVTKEGAIAGPRVLEHIVDTVLYFEGDAHSSFRLVRAIKNRFGAANELGVFAMTERGLKGVTNPSALFLSQHDAGRCRQLHPRHGRRVAPDAGRGAGAGRSVAGRASPGGWRWASIRSVSRCCWRCCIVTAASRPAISTSMSTRSAGCASASRRPIWPS